MKNGISQNLSFSIYIEKIKDKGEDSKPLFLLGDSSILLGVFDGLGGAGSIKKYQIQNNNEYNTGAYIASRVACNFSKEFFTENNFLRYLHTFIGIKKVKNSYFNFSKNDDDIKIIENQIKKFLNSFKKSLLEELVKKEKLYGNNKIVSKIKSKSINILPTTMSLMYSTKIQNKNYIFSFWAGDSRNYRLSEDGLMQLTCDDIDNINMSLESINSNAPMNNYVNISKPFNINFNWCVDEDMKQIFIVATDGAFGVFDSPLLFELTILDTLNTSSSLKMWKTQLTKILEKKQNDDISFVLHCIGFTSFEDIKEFYKVRINYLHSKANIYTDLENDITILKKNINTLKEDLVSKEKLYQSTLNKDWGFYNSQYLKYIKQYYNSVN